MDATQSPFAVGDRVFFWSGRGSQGYGTIREIRDGRAFLDPEPDAVKGSDYRVFRQPANATTVGRHEITASASAN